MLNGHSAPRKFCAYMSYYELLVIDLATMAGKPPSNARARRALCSSLRGVCDKLGHTAVCDKLCQSYLSHLSVRLCHICLSDLSVRSVCQICLSHPSGKRLYHSQTVSLLAARSVHHICLSHALTEICQVKFDALFHGPLCHDFNQITRAKKAFATNNVALQVFTLIKGYRSWVGPNRFSVFWRL